MVELDKFDGFNFELDYEDIIEKNSQELADNIKASAKSIWGAKSPYAKDWTFKMKKEKGGRKYGVVYNKKHYRLTHLLEHGHIVWNAITKKRVAPKPHIAPNFAKQKEKFIDEMGKCKIKEN